MTDNTAVIKKVEGRGVPVLGNDIDTDRIIPARFLRCVTFEGLGEQVFRDERYDEGGTQKVHAFNESKFSGASVLIVNRNFGCGSSREHAPQALMRFGIKAIVGESFGEIFAGNCISIGIPVFTTDEQTIGEIQERVDNEPEMILSLDVERETLKVGERQVPLSMNSSVKTALLEGTWNTLDELLLNSNEIEAVYDRLPYVSQFA